MLHTRIAPILLGAAALKEFWHTNICMAKMRAFRVYIFVWPTIGEKSASTRVDLVGK